jgi:hypothetical protein
MRKVLTGRTKPAIFMCEDEGGTNAGEFVVKFKAGTEAGVTGLACELIAAALADKLGLMTPNPAIVDLDPTIGELLSERDSDVAAIISKSPGLNYGSQVLIGGYGVIPIQKRIPDSIRALAAEVFAFDALIQNPDRKVHNQNLLWKGNEIFLIDHELAFSFLYAIGASVNSWEVRGDMGDFLNEHVFYRELKGQEIDLSRFLEALQATSDEDIDDLFDQLPTEWNNSSVFRIHGHLGDVRDHAEEFINQVEWRLA